MDHALKIKLRKYYSEEQIRIMELMESLGFHASSVDVRILKNIELKDFEINTSHVEWMPIDYFSLMREVLEKIEGENKTPASPTEFISAISKMDKITGVRIGFLQLEKIGWGHLVSIESIQRSIGSILAGDGFAPGCLFAVKTPNLI